MVYVAAITGQYCFKSNIGLCYEVLNKTTCQSVCWTPNDSMGSEIVRPESNDAAPTSTEVEFALVLSRMIDSVNNDPEHLRATVYELARHKLKEQFGSDQSVDMGQLTKSLEVAIHGVESFVKKEDESVPALPKPGSVQQRRISAPTRDSSVQPAASVIDVGPERKASRFSVAARLVAVIAIGLGVAFAVKQRSVIDAFQRQVGRIAATTSTPASEPQSSQTAQARTEPAAVQPSPLTPTAYGIYAVSEEKLYELELLPGRTPDLRVTVSPAILTPSKTILPDGHVKFVVYRRDSATNAADHAEIRVVARVAQEMNFDKSGKPALSKINDTWVIRNISIPFRTAPKRDNPDMYEVQSENPETALTPGRYALVIKGQAYDFSVAGEVTDRKQCLERLAATNGQFYSECQKP